MECQRYTWLPCSHAPTGGTALKASRAPVTQAVKTRSAYAKKPQIGALIPVTQYTKWINCDKKMTKKRLLLENRRQHGSCRSFFFGKTRADKPVDIWNPSKMHYWKLRSRMYFLTPVWGVRRGLGCRRNQVSKGIERVENLFKYGPDWIQGLNQSGTG